MELFTATGKLKNYGTHQYDIQVLATHADACGART